MKISPAYIVIRTLYILSKVFILSVSALAIYMVGFTMMVAQAVLPSPLNLLVYNLQALPLTICLFPFLFEFISSIDGNKFSDFRIDIEKQKNGE